MPTLTSKIAYNTFIQAIGKTFSIFLGLVVVAIMTRYLGQDGYGYYTTIIAYLQIFGILVDLGLNVMIVQLISEPGANEKKTVSNIFTMRLIFAFIFFGIAPIIIWFFPYSNEVKIGTSAATLSFFCIALIQILSGVYQKHLKMNIVSFAEVFGRFFLLGITLLAVYYNLGLLGIMIAVSIGSIVNFLIVYFYSFKLIKINLAFDFAYWKNVMKKSWPIALSISLNLIYLRADTVILSLYKSAGEVGIYGAAYRVLDIITMFPHMFMGLVLPILTLHWSANNFERFKHTLQKSFDFFTVFSVPLVFCTLFLATKVMVLVAGNEFEMSGPILKILIVASAMIFYGTMYSYCVVSLNKQKQMLWGFLITAVLSLAGYLVLIPKYSYFGAAYVTVFSETLIALIGFVIVYKTTKILPKANLLLKALASSAIMAVILYFSSSFGLIIQLLLAILAFFGVMYLLKGITKEMVRELLGK